MGWIEDARGTEVHIIHNCAHHESRCLPLPSAPGEMSKCFVYSHCILHFHSTLSFVILKAGLQDSFSQTGLWLYLTIFCLWPLLPASMWLQSFSCFGPFWCLWEVLFHTFVHLLPACLLQCFVGIFYAVRMLVICKSSKNSSYNLLNVTLCQALC